ncbi:MAG: acyl-CoA dehydrogenase [Microbacterium sp.]
MSASGISLRPGDAPSHAVRDAAASARDVPDFGVDIDATLEWARVAVSTIPRGHSPREQWELLATTAYIDVAAARVLEPHLDALNILTESGVRPDDLAPVGADAASTWGVYAAEGPGVRVDAETTPSGWRLNGTKPWCSLAAQVSHALVTAHVEGGRRLFAVSLRDEGVRTHPGPWLARGLAAVVSAPVDFDDVVAVPIGDVDWYLRRPGFATGAIGVAACWWGGAAGLLPALARAARRDDADQLARLHLGRADAAMWAARASLHEAADLEAVDSALLASRVRSIVADAAELALRECDHALGPAPLVADEAHARRVADLHLYLRQHHGERDAVRVGRDAAGSW